MVHCRNGRRLASGGRGRSGSFSNCCATAGRRTRSELADLTGLARSTIAARVDELIASGLVTAAGEAGRPAAGRPTGSRSIPHARVVLAADLGATHATSRSPTSAAPSSRRSTEPIAIADGPVRGA